MKSGLGTCINSQLSLDCLLDPNNRISVAKVIHFIKYTKSFHHGGGWPKTFGRWTPVYVPYCTLCAARKRINYPDPATREEFRSHPTTFCKTNHPGYIKYAIGCSIHEGVRNFAGLCAWCEQEKVTLSFLDPIPIERKVGYIE